MLSWLRLKINVFGKSCHAFFEDNTDLFPPKDEECGRLANCSLSVSDEIRIVKKNIYYFICNAFKESFGITAKYVCEIALADE